MTTFIVTKPYPILRFKNKYFKKKISRFRMLYSTPLFHPWQNPPTYPLYNPDKYCKMFFSGGLAQLVSSGLAALQI
jgi:hypothetical protein